MEKVEKIIDYYVLTTKLKDLIRSGWKEWNVKKSRLESVAEHVYGTCMLATAIWSETLPKVNLAEVLLTLAIHETEEIFIGDITPFDEEYKTKKAKGEKAVQHMFKDMLAKDVFVNLIKNFDEKSTPEAIFAYKCDKLECDLQAKLYDESGYMKFENASDKIKKNERIKALKEKGIKNPATFFIYNTRQELLKYKEDDEKEEDMFLQISKYIEKNKISLQSKKDWKIYWLNKFFVIKHYSFVEHCKRNICATSFGWITKIFIF